MSESRPEKHKIEFIESYWTGGELGSDYQWNDNHGELIRCKNCKWLQEYESGELQCEIKQGWFPVKEDWYCADGVKRDG